MIAQDSACDGSSAWYTWRSAPRKDQRSSAPLRSALEYTNLSSSRGPWLGRSSIMTVSLPVPSRDHDSVRTALTVAFGNTDIGNVTTSVVPCQEALGLVAAACCGSGPH